MDSITLQEPYSQTKTRGFTKVMGEGEGEGEGNGEGRLKMIPEKQITQKQM